MGLTLIRKSRNTKPKQNPVVALVLAGGAVSGGAFKVGGLKALDDFLVGRKITELDTYVGISAGALLAASLAAGITPDEMIKVLDRRSKRFDQLRSWRERPAGVRWGVGMAAAMCAVWWLYVVTSGGDFMEFRFLVPSIPLLLIGIGFLLHGASPRLRLSFITLLLLGNFFQFFATEYLGTRWELYRKGFSSVDALDVSFPARWHVIGRRLGEIFEHDRGVVIAVNPVGVITYQSDLTCVDLFGLNDRWVARHGSYDPKAPPGHRRQATLGYLVERGVHLLIGHPYEIAPGKARHIRFDAETLGRLYLQVPEEVLPRLAGRVR